MDVSPSWPTRAAMSTPSGTSLMTTAPYSGLTPEQAGLAAEYRGAMSGGANPYVLPSDLPVPVDDGAADHLIGATIPELTLSSTSDRYPRTGRPDEELPE